MVSFNAFGNSAKKFGGNQPVWLGVVSPLAVGGSLAPSFVKAGAFYPAGMPINITDKVISPFVNWIVKAVDTSNHAITVFANGLAPEKDEILCGVGATFAATGAAGKVSAVAAVEGGLKITFTTAALDGVAVGSVIAYSSASAAATSGAALAVQPNAYLYNDIYLGDLEENAGATGAAVVAHNEGILVDRTLAGGIKALMAAAVPNVIQVNG